MPAKKTTPKPRPATPAELKRMQDALFAAFLPLPKKRR